MATDAWIELPKEGGGGGGSVNSVTASSPLDSSLGSDPNISFIDIAAGLVLAGPVSGAAAPPTFRALTGGDIDGFAPNTFAGFDNTGALENIPGFNINTTTGGMDESFTKQPNNGGGSNLNGINLSFDPLQNSPDETWSVQNIQVNFDVNSSGFSQGTNGSAAQLLNLGFTHHGTGNVGGLFYIQANSDIGNGTDPITVKGMGWMFGFTNVHANVTLDGSLQGYTFQPTVDAAAAGTSNFGVSAFEDFANINIPVNGYNSFSSGPDILSITNNNSYQGYIAGPNITTLTGNASASGFNFFGNITTMGASSSINGFSFGPAITTSHGNITGININPNLVGGDANFTGVNINPQGGATSANVTGISINLSSITSTDPQGATGLTSDSRINVNANVDHISNLGFQIINRIEGLLHVPSGGPVTGTDSLANNFAGDLSAEDNLAIGPAGLGFNSVGFITDLAVAATKTVDSVTVFLPALALPDPGYTTGGNITNLAIVKTFAPFPQGGTVNITNLYGYKIDALAGSFSASATNAWGLYFDDANLQNYIGGRLSLGVTTTTTNSKFTFKNGHITSQQTTPPTVTVSSNAGTGGSGSVSNATDSAGKLELITGTLTLATGPQITVNFNKSYAVAPIVILTPNNSTAAQAAVATYPTSTTTGFVVNFVVASVGSQTFDWFYNVMETQ